MKFCTRFKVYNWKNTNEKEEGTLANVWILKFPIDPSSLSFLKWPFYKKYLPCGFNFSHAVTVVSAEAPPSLLLWQQERRRKKKQHVSLPSIYLRVGKVYKANLTAERLPKVSWGQGLVPPQSFSVCILMDSLQPRYYLMICFQVFFFNPNETHEMKQLIH